MKEQKGWFLLILVLTLIVMPVDLIGQRAGLRFLDFPLGPRAAAMGNAYVAIADDVTSIFWNPAGLANFEGTELYFQRDQLLLDISQSYFAVAFHPNKFSIGMSFSYMDLGEIERRSANTPDPEGTFRPFDIALSGGMGYRIDDRLLIGVTIRGVIEEIDKVNASNVLADLGILYKTSLEGLTLGANFQNFGSKLVFEDVPFDPPTRFIGGAAYSKPMENANSRITIAADVNVPTTADETQFQIGGEWLYKSFLAGRGGYKFKTDTENFTAGLGIKYKNFRIDYAFVPFNSDLGQTHRIGFLYRFEKNSGVMR